MSQFNLTHEEDQTVLDALRSKGAAYTAMFGSTETSIEALIAKVESRKVGRSRPRSNRVLLHHRSQRKPRSLAPRRPPRLHRQDRRHRRSPRHRARHRRASRSEVGNSTLRSGSRPGARLRLRRHRRKRLGGLPLQTRQAHHSRGRALESRRRRNRARLNANGIAAALVDGDGTGLLRLHETTRHL